ncbi:MAG: FtsX-like permease family protein [Candidatus Cloacimonadaceae bacterium]|nr:FtsX-like permease family protein [Candidatus Cloacimonadaceae bacterium]
MKASNNRSIGFLARRYLKGRSGALIGKSHYLTLAGITLGVLALLAVNSVMNGFRCDVEKRIIGTLSEIRIGSANSQPLKGSDSLIQSLEKQGYRAAPVIRNELLIKRGTIVMPGVCFGIDPVAQPRISSVLMPSHTDKGELRQGIVVGHLDPYRFNAGGIILGAGLAMHLGISFGDQVQLISPIFNVPTAFGLLPRVRTLEVQGIFESGMPEYQQSFCYIPLEVGAFFSGYTEEVDYIELRSPDSRNTQRYLSRLREELKDLEVNDWSSFDSSLYDAIRFEKFIMFVIMLFMYIIASFNLTGNMLKAIAQKKRELGLLKAIGFRDSELRNLFLLQSLILSTIGIALGLLLATALLLLQQQFGIIKFALGGAQHIVLPVRMLPSDYIIVVTVSYLITMISVLLPLKRLRRVDPVEMLRQTV